MNKTDVLSDVFSTLRIRSDLYFLADLNGDFSIEVPSEKRRIRFHLVRHGRCWLRLPDGAVQALSEGDLAIVPNGVAQILSGAPDVAPVSLPEAISNGTLENGLLTYGEGERRVRLLCGFCQYDEAIDHPVLSGLPPLLTVRSEDLGSEPWTAATLRLLAMEVELDSQGSTGILTRLLEIVFIQTVRRIEAGLRADAQGFVAALSDIRLSRALRAIHATPGDNWTTAGLAAQAGMSRARFAERFAALVGMPPIAYLTHWRLILARDLLSNSPLDMSEIAARCGYASVPSFSRRFKEAFGVGPGTYRRSLR